MKRYIQGGKCTNVYYGRTADGGQRTADRGQQTADGGLSVGARVVFKMS
jgi:hypothetical protein